MRTIKWGLIGLSKWSRDVFIPAILNAKKSKLIAVMSRNCDPKFTRELNRNRIKVYDNIDDFLSNALIDIVWIVTSDFLHYDHAEKCLYYNKHVLIEKPMCETSEQCLQIKNLSFSLKKDVYVGYNNRFNDIHKNVKKLISQDFFGEIVSIKASFFKKYDFIKNEWKVFENNRGGWAMSHIATHFIDLLIWMFNSKLKIQYSKLSSPSFDHETEDYCFILFTCKKIICTIECSTGMDNEYTSKIEISGTNGYVTLYDTLVSNGYIKSNRIKDIAIGNHQLDRFGNDAYKNQVEHISRILSLKCEDVDIYNKNIIDDYIMNVKLMERIRAENIFN